MPVNAQIGFMQIAELQKELLQPAYAHSLIFVAWEHVKLYEFARKMLQDYGAIRRRCPTGQTAIMRRFTSFTSCDQAKDGAPRATLDIQNENLGNTLSDACPGPQ